MEATTVPTPGQIAKVRQRRYLVEEVVPPPRGGDSTLVRLSCVDDDNQGRRLEVLWERELDAEVLSGEAWDAIATRGFDDAKVFAAYLNTLRWNCVTATDHAAQRTFEQLLSAAGDSGSSAFLPWSTGAALLDGRDPIPDTIIRQLQSSAPRDVRELLPFLESRGQEYIGDAEQKLAERGAVEARAMREILETQKKHIQTTYARHENMDDRQLRLNYGDDLEELRQLELNKRYWAKRLETIDNELNTEPERIRDLYQVKARRIEPVGLVYLWPVTG